MTIAPRVKPKLRGVLHLIGFVVAVGLAVPLILTAPEGKARVAATIFALCVAACFGASALYHRPTWRPDVRGRLARLDHAGIYLLIAGTYTPFALLVFSPGWAIPVLAVVWTGAVAAITMKVVWLGTPKWLSAAIGITLGWVAVIAITQLLKVPAPGLALMLVGGVLYTAGAVIYAVRRPDLAPAVFGYHELFHAFTLAAVGCQYAAIAFWVLPRGA
jgi:hemolysin III